MDYPLIQTRTTKSYRGRNESALSFRMKYRFKLHLAKYPNDDVLADFDLGFAVLLFVSMCRAVCVVLCSEVVMEIDNYPN